MGRSQRLPRSFWPLIAAAVVAALLLWWLARRGDDDGRVGLLVRWDPQAMTGVELVRDDGRYVLSRTADRWQLGGAVTDWVDDQAVAQFLRGVTVGSGGEILPGTETRDQRFGFGGPEAVSFAVSDAGGRRLMLDFGAINPVSGLRYASGSEWRGVFVVTDPYRSLLRRMPDLIRLKTLLPPFARSDVDTIWIGRGGSGRLLLVRRGQDWWLREPASGFAALGTQVRLYHTYYRDRSQSEDGVRWLLASRRRLSNLIFEVSETGLVGFGPPDPGAAFLREAGLQPPYRAVALKVRGFAEPLRVEFGEVDDDIGQVTAVRQGAVVVAQATALRTVELAGGELVDTGALSFALADADSYRVTDASDRPLVGGWRTGDGRWLATAPSGYRVRSPGEQSDNLVGDLVTDLDRLPAERILPPAAHPPRPDFTPPTDDLSRLTELAPLQPEPRVVLTAWFAGGRRTQVVFGRLDRPWPPESSTAQTTRPAEPGTPVVFDTQDTKLLAVDEQTLITFRALQNFLVPDSR